MLPVLDTTHTTLDACTRSLSFRSRIRSCTFHLLVATESIGASLSTLFSTLFRLLVPLEILDQHTTLNSSTATHSTTTLFSSANHTISRLPTGVRTDATPTRSLPLPTPLDNSTRAPSRRDPRNRFFSTPPPPHRSALTHLREPSSSPISTRLLSCCSRSSLCISRLSCTSHFQARQASPSLSEICPRRFPIRHPLITAYLNPSTLSTPSRPFSRLVLSASLLQHHHIGATHYLPLP